MVSGLFGRGTQGARVNENDGVGVGSADGSNVGNSVGV
jgi:hypothetical protein